MDEEKFQRAIDTRLDQQARFYSDLQELKDIHKEAGKRTGVLERVCLNLYNSSVEQGNNITELTNHVKDLVAAQKETDERVNAVILMEEKFFGGQNGK